MPNDGLQANLVIARMAITETGCMARTRRKSFDLHVANMCSSDAYQVPAKGSVQCGTHGDGHRLYTSHPDIGS